MHARGIKGTIGGGNAAISKVSFLCSVNLYNTDIDFSSLLFGTLRTVTLFLL